MRIDRSINSRDGEGDCEITEEALLDVGTRINPNKAVGVDDIPGAVVKELVEKRTDRMLRVNDVNNSGRMPALWKVARVVLIPKPSRDPALTSSFRQINALPALNKDWEHTSKNLIEEKLGLDVFHKDQYGFRRKKSTVDALCRVVQLAENCRRNRICVLAAMDIENTFSWGKILMEAEARGMSRKLLILLDNYLEDRKIVIRNIGGTVKRNVFAGVPQGFILGPLLWDLVYDELLKELQNIPRMSAVAFVDDLALILDVLSQEEIGNRLSRAMSMITQRCADNGLTIEHGKIEAILLTGKCSELWKLTLEDSY